MCATPNRVLENWLLSQRIGFAATCVTTVAGQETDAQRKLAVALFHRAGRFLEEQVIDSVFRKHTLTPSALSLLASLRPDACRSTRRADASCRFDITAIPAIAQRERAKLDENRSRGRLIDLANVAATMLMDNGVPFATFSRWAFRVLPRLRRWQRVAHDISDAQAVDGYLKRIRDKGSSTIDRLAFIGLLDDTVRSIHGYEPALWNLIATTLISRLFCTPLLVACQGRVHIGISLPFDIRLSECARPVEFILDAHTEFSRHAEGDFGFAGGRITFSDDWIASLQRSVSNAKELWRSQNSRRSLDELEATDRKTLEIDITIAERIVQSVYDNQIEASARYQIGGRSAESYFTQTALSLLLPTGRLPTGVATGLTTATKNGGTLIGDVEETKLKLLYARNSGTHPYIVLANTVRTRDDVRTLIEDMESSRGIEIKYRSTTRGAADAMQASGWRRTRFIRAPVAGRVFYQTLGQLGDVVRRGQSAEQPDRVFSTEESSKLKRICEILTENPSAVTFRPHMSEYQLGRWLAFVDERLRSYNRSRGLGVFCIRTTERESPMRFWEHLLQALGVTERNSEDFRWASPQAAACLLQMVLNNFHGDPTISTELPPDLLVIIDDADFCKGETDCSFPTDYRGQLHALLEQNPLTQQLDTFDAASRSVYFGQTRILVIQSTETQAVMAEDDAAEAPAHSSALKRLSIFRHDFSLQEGVSVLGLSWAEGKKQVDELVEARKVFQHRDRYHLRNKPRVAHKECADAEVHLVAADAISPLASLSLAPYRANADRSLDSIATTEAIWHLREALTHADASDLNLRTSVNLAQARLLLSRPSADWDTVSALTNAHQHNEALDLAKELLEREERGSAENLAHPTRYARAIALAARRIRERPDRSVAWLPVAADWFEKALSRSRPIGAKERQYCDVRVHSEYAYCLRGIKPLAGTKRTALHTIEESLGRFIEEWHRSKCVDVVRMLSQGWLRDRWNDESLPPTDRTLYAYLSTVLWPQWRTPWISLRILNQKLMRPRKPLR